MFIICCFARNGLLMHTLLNNSAMSCPRLSGARFLPLLTRSPAQPSRAPRFAVAHLVGRGHQEACLTQSDRDASTWSTGCGPALHPEDTEL